jgi:hypothetical protein
MKSSLLCGASYKGHILLGEVVKRLADLGEVLDEALVEIVKSNETPEFFELCRWCPISNSFHLDWVHGNFARADDQSEVVDMGLLKLAVLGLEVQIVFFETPKDFMDNLLMFVKSGTPDENVIEIDCYFAFSNQICKDGIY